MIHYDLTVSGDVQNVWYRKFTKTQADELGMNGFSMNQENGTVYVEIEGAEDKIDEFIERCKEGPELARVDHVEKAAGEFRSYLRFEIRY